MPGGRKEGHEGRVREIWTCSCTEKGIRERNEDSCGVFAISHAEGTLFLLAVADGLGGHPAGEVASSLAIRALYTAVTSAIESLRSIDLAFLQPVLAAGFSQANREVTHHAATVRGCEGMGTTLVAAIVNGEGDIVVGNVGDSRAYLLGEGINKITRDHSRVQEMVDQGLVSVEEAAIHPLRHIVTRIVGRPGDFPDFYTIHLGDDLLVLCSDGLLDGISEHEMHVVAGGHRTPGICKRLVEIAKDRSRDNISVVAAGCR